MTMAAFSIELTSVPDRDELVAEVWAGDELFAELRHSTEGVWVQIYSPTTSGPWDIRLSDLLEALEKARQRLGPARS